MSEMNGLFGTSEIWYCEKNSYNPIELTLTIFKQY